MYSKALSKLPLLLTCHNLILFNGEFLLCNASIATLSGFNTLPTVAAGFGVIIEVPAPTIQILPSTSTNKDVAISFVIDPNLKFHI